MTQFYVHKYRVTQKYGGPEEGGWWYTAGVPAEPVVTFAYDSEEQANQVCRSANARETKRRVESEPYDFSSVLSHRGTYYEYDVSEERKPSPFPVERPHYE